jgi:predicted phage-related endonuclease
MSIKATTQEDYLKKVSAETIRAQSHYPDSSAEAMSIRNSLRVLNILSEKTIEWLIENADKNSEMGTFFEQGMTWRKLVKSYLNIDL